jgi:hypothetical protein
MEFLWMGSQELKHSDWLQSGLIPELQAYYQDQSKTQDLRDQIPDNVMELVDEKMQLTGMYFDAAFWQVLYSSLASGQEWADAFVNMTDQIFEKADTIAGRYVPTTSYTAVQKIGPSSYIPVPLP